MFGLPGLLVAGGYEVGDWAWRNREHLGDWGKNLWKGDKLGMDAALAKAGGYWSGAGLSKKDMAAFHSKQQIYKYRNALLKRKQALVGSDVGTDATLGYQHFGQFFGGFDTKSFLKKMGGSSAKGRKAALAKLFKLRGMFAQYASKSLSGMSEKDRRGAVESGQLQLIFPEIGVLTEMMKALAQTMDKGELARTLRSLQKQGLMIELDPKQMPGVRAKGRKQPAA